MFGAPGDAVEHMGCAVASREEARARDSRITLTPKRPAEAHRGAPENRSKNWRRC
jgi:hypothetical protein